ncbi:HD-GYP domain-containing protein [Ahniella affigens]|uniref:HD-GYP domain-containing protein n=1 Tax=Ahniella affigens TaxID=2021234 RepID=A0A2P1PRC0_9GAMM|nr:HD-GYP domain-containing protein [Ahniella affigens]AVP97372.1 HD-GYP domain-containing protein [Ahniella affigens]
MQLEERKVHVDYLRPGMFVHRLDRDWLGLPFPLEGFLLDTSGELDVLRRHCDHVFVDVYRSRLPLHHFDVNGQTDGRRRHVNQVALAEELPRVQKQFARTAEITARILGDLRSGRKLSLVEVQDAIVPVVQSVLRHADAYLWVSMLKRRDEYEFSHAMNNSLLASVLGRHLGLGEGELVALATGGMLLDVGKTAIPTALLRKVGLLSEGEMMILRHHVEQGIALMSQSSIREPQIEAMVRTHHERFDGSGYPNGLVRNQIPLYGRIAGIIDTFDALTSDRPFRQAISPQQALQQIYRAGDRLFQKDLVEQFMQCLSVYPTGSLIELTTGEVAVVMAQNPARRLKPWIMVLTDASKRARSRFLEVDLLNQSPTDVPRDIVRSLERGAHGVFPERLGLV